jgi:hypothetical protein
MGICLLNSITKEIACVGIDEKLVFSQPPLTPPIQEENLSPFAAGNSLPLR